jgi:TRAP-type transport system periplasmic protein
MKKFAPGLVALIVLVALIAACSAPAGPTATAPAGTTSAGGKLIEITVNNHNPPGPPSDSIHAWAKEVEKNCNGKVKIIMHDGGSLLQADEAYRGTQTGVCDAAYYVINRMDGFFVNDVVSLPFMGYPDQAKTGKIYEELYATIPAMKSEWKGVMPYKFMMMPGSHIHNKNKVVKTIADLKGLKLFTAESTVTQSTAALGATPVDIDIADMYTSVDKGVCDGVVNHIAVLKVFGALDLLKTHTVVGEGINKTPMGIIFNEAKFKSYPADVQKGIMDSAQLWHDTFLKADLGFQALCWGITKERKDTTINLTEAEIAEWTKVVKGPVHDKWMADAKSKGLDGPAVYDAALKLIAKYK